MEEINAHGDALSLFYPDPAIRDEVIRSVTTDPAMPFREWHPVYNHTPDLLCLEKYLKGVLL